jgi:hypothetical protein
MSAAEHLIKELIVISRKTLLYSQEQVMKNVSFKNYFSRRAGLTSIIFRRIASIRPAASESNLG